MPAPSIVEVQPARFIAASRPFNRAKRPSLIREAFDQVYAFKGLGKQGLNVILYRGTEFDAGVIVEREVVLPTDLSYLQLPGGRAVTVEHWGDYSGIPAAHEALQLWVEQQDLELDGACWEVYGHHDDDPAKLRTEIFYLLIKS
jgi:effector-binding domain-containing protein